MGVNLIRDFVNNIVVFGLEGLRKLGYMAIPKHDDIRVPALNLLSENETLKLNEFELPLAERFGLSEEEMSQEYESGNGKIFYDRISWALSYMNMAGLVQKPKRGIYEWH